MTESESATKRQLWYLHILTKTDTRELQITKSEANQRIRLALAGVVPKNETVVKPESKRKRAVPIIRDKKKEPTFKTAPKSNGFDCWHCHNGHEHQDLLADTHPYILCGCGASTVSLPRFKTSRNRRGGIKGIALSKPFVSSVTSADRYAMAKSAEQFAEATA